MAGICRLRCTESGLMNWRLAASTRFCWPLRRTRRTLSPCTAWAERRSWLGKPTCGGCWRFGQRSLRRARGRGVLMTARLSRFKGGHGHKLQFPRRWNCCEQDGGGTAEDGEQGSGTAGEHSCVAVAGEREEAFRGNAGSQGRWVYVIHH